MRFPRLSFALLLAAAPVTSAIAQPAEPWQQADDEPASPVAPEPEPEIAPEPEPTAEPEAVAVPAPVTAADAEWSDPSLAEDTSEVMQIHGWVSQGAFASLHNNYLANTTDGSFEFFEAGLNVTKELGSNLRTGVQIFAQDLGPIGNYEPVIDWAYVDYRRSPGLGVRAGRFKMPLYLYNERMDADMTRTTVLMPQAVYDQHFRDVLNAVSGVDVYGTLDVGGAGTIDYDAYAGTVYIQPRGAVYDLEHVLGARVTWDAPGCMRASSHFLYSNFSAADTVDDATRDAIIMAGGAPAGWDGTVTQDYSNWKMYGGALECATEKWTITAEAGIWEADTTTSPMIEEPGQYRELRGYAQAEHRINDRFSTAAYLSLYNWMDDWSTSSDDGDHQYDAALSLRYDVTPNWLVKAEVHAIDGYGLTEGSLNRGRERKDNWGMFLAKTTLTF